MNPYKSLERLSWRFSQGKAFTPNENDIVALNVLISFFEVYEKEEFMDNLLFGKLYIQMFKELTVFYGSPPDSPIPQKELHKILDKSFNQLFAELKDSINMVDAEVQAKNGKMPIPDRWGIDEIRENMNSMIVKAIETYKRKK